MILLLLLLACNEPIPMSEMPWNGCPSIEICADIGLYSYDLWAALGVESSEPQTGATWIWVLGGWAGGGCSRTTWSIESLMDRYDVAIDQVTYAIQVSTCASFSSCGEPETFWGVFNGPAGAFTIEDGIGELADPIPESQCTIPPIEGP